MKKLVYLIYFNLMTDYEMNYDVKSCDVQKTEVTDG